MGDIRNKLEKEIRAAKHAAWIAKHHPPKPQLPLPRCQCGNTWYDAPILWQIEVVRWPREMAWFCPACLPFKYFPLVAKQVANLPDHVAGSLETPDGEIEADQSKAGDHQP